MGTCEEYGEAVLYRENGLSTGDRLLTTSMTLSHKSMYLSDPQSPLQQSRNNNT